MLVLLGFTLLGFGAYAQEDPAAAATNELAHTSLPEVIAGIPATEFYVLTVVLCLELVVVFLLSMFIHMLLKTIRQVPEAEEALLAKKTFYGTISTRLFL